MERRTVLWLGGILFPLFFLMGVSRAQEDRAGCQDHPMFTRMPHFYLENCRVADYEQAEFSDAKGNKVKVEGKYSWARYKMKKGLTSPSPLQVIRNFQQAVRKIGGETVYEKMGSNYGYTYLTLKKPSLTAWVVVATHGGDYELTVVEKTEMAQEVVADAKSLMKAISTSGHAAVYGIYFDFDKAEIKPESDTAIREIARLLQENKGLKIYLVGHTDHVGGLDYNLKLSKERADAVLKELVGKYKIAPDRIKAFGMGPLAPVASNKTEEGRAKNRRVELVEQ